MKNATLLVVGREDASQRLCRYVPRPALDQSSLARTRDGRVVCRLERSWKNGTTLAVLDPLVPIA